MNLVYEKCKNCYEDIWNAEMLLKPKLRTYVTSKNKFEPEWYVRRQLTRKQRALVAQFRCGVY